MKGRLSSLLLCLVVSLSLQAAPVLINNPKVGNYALDYCRVWGKECGKPAADAYCRKHGYRSAWRYSIEHNNPPTRVIKGGQVCNQPHCDRIKRVECLKDNIYTSPKVKGDALDFCREWGKNCGKPAADAYCKSRGHKRSTNYKVSQNTPPTRVIKGGKRCTSPHCDRIVSVTCLAKKPRRPKQSQGRGIPDDCGACDMAGDPGVYDDWNYE